jgi:hypothetical protein
MHSGSNKLAILLFAAALANISAAQDASQAPQAASQSKPDDIPQANPGRPTVTNPATIPPVGYLQFEQGFIQADDSPGLTSQFSLNQTTKLAVASRLMVQFLSQPFASTQAAGVHSRDAGDLQLGAQVILLPRTGPIPTVALGYIGRVRSGTAPDLDVGSFSQSALVLFSGDVGKFHYDSNFIVSERESGPIRRAQYGQTLSVTHPIFNPNLTLTGELWHFTQPFVPPSPASSAGGNAVATLWAVAWSARPNLVLDVAVDRGLTSTSTQWEGFAGFTYLLPKRLWGKR